MVSALIESSVATSRTPKFLSYTGRPCCWISRMAPGILPLATSLRMKSLTRANSSLEKCCAPSPADPARTTSRQLAPARASTSASTASLRDAARSVLHGFIDQLLQRPLDALAFARSLLQQHEEHVLLAVDHEVAAAGAVPFQFT